MFRKLAFACVAVAAVGAAALAPTAASAAWHGGWHGGGWHGGWGGPRVIVGAPYGVYGGACVVRRVVETPFGPQVRWVDVC